MNNKFEVIETAAQPVLSIRKVTSVEKLPDEIGKAYQLIISYLQEVGQQPAEAPFTAYYNMDMEKLEVEMGFPVSEELQGKGDIAASVIPAGKKAVCMYKGSYQDMAPTYDAMTKWIIENGYQPTGIAYEFYYNSPMEVPESELLTKIMFLLR